MKHLFGAIFFFVSAILVISGGLVAYLSGPYAQTTSSLCFLGAMLILGIALTCMSVASAWKIG